MNDTNITSPSKPEDRRRCPIIFFAILLSMTSCQNFLQVEVEKSQITKDLVFRDELTASSAIAGIYSEMYSGDTNFGNGSPYSVSALAGLSANEILYGSYVVDWKEFQDHALSPNNNNVFTIWASAYKAIYMANSALEGLDHSSELSDSVSNQLRGEALFIRAFCHFYLVNLFGNVPQVISTNYDNNAKRTQSASADLYALVTSDLVQAQSLMSNKYITDGRGRPNKGTVTAMLARVYLYMADWARASQEASKVIDDPQYSLETNLDVVFLATSKEAVWQLIPPGISKNTNEGSLFILTGPPSDFTHPFQLSPALINSFEPGDERKAHWVNSINTPDTSYYYPFKYKIPNGLPLREYSMVLRLAEQYLIRAEARAQQDDLNGAVKDLDLIRKRAGLQSITNSNPSITKQDLLRAIEHERQVEFFTEWGHRWLDLKRTNRADIFLDQDPNWSISDQAYPIPQTELDRDHSLMQNMGY